MYETFFPSHRCCFPQTSLNSPNLDSLCESLKFLFNSLSKTEKPVTPLLFLTCLHSVCPQFASRASSSDASKSAPGALSMITHGFEQQDASECWTELIRALQSSKIDSQVYASTVVTFLCCSYFIIFEYFAAGL